MSFFDWSDSLPGSLKPGFQPPSCESEEDMKRRHHSELIEYERFATKMRSEYSKPIDKSRAIQQLSRLKQQLKDRHVAEEAVLSSSERGLKKTNIVLNVPPSQSATSKERLIANDLTMPKEFPTPGEARGLIGGALAHANRMFEQTATKVVRSTVNRTAMDNEILERYVKKMEVRSGPGARFGFIQKINQKAAALGKRVVAMETDNHCLYNSIIAGLHGPAEDAQSAVKQLRNLVGDFILANEDYYADMINTMMQMSIGTYVEGVKTEAIGDELECLIAAKVLGATVHLITPDDETRVFPPDGPSEADIWIAYYPSYTILGDAHYNALK